MPDITLTVVHPYVMESPVLRDAQRRYAAGELTEGELHSLHKRDYRIRLHLDGKPVGLYSITRPKAEILADGERIMGIKRAEAERD